MAYDLPTHRRSEHARTDVLSSSFSEAITLSPDEPSATPGHDGRSKGDVRRGNSFLARNFGSGRPQASDKDDMKGPLGLRSLFRAPEPLIDLIFVHGLRGGSIKTWRYGEDEQLFWPRYWLPNEPEFANASIHSFGYDSDWGSVKPSILNVHDFGQSLYEELLTSPLLRHGPKNSPIILIGHSMGGLVIKKAYILAQDDRTHPQLAQRLRCVFFLATPHRGSDYAAVLNSVLKYCGVTGLTSSREYIKDLTTGSASTQLINSEFARLAGDVTVYSFCETLPTISGSSGLIVEKASAILGLHPQNEHVQYLRANHRDICKFRSRQDSNYNILKNALATTVENLIRNAFTTNDEDARDQMRDIEHFLRLGYVPEEHYDKLEGSCQWIEHSEHFRTWIRTEHEYNLAQTYCPSIFWVQAQPGAGKTMLAAHVISQLSQLRLPHALHFFHFGKKSAQSLAGLLQSLALQMAKANAAIREKLAEIQANASSFDQDDARIFWQKIFVGGIFQLHNSTPQFWVIDAIDECIKYAELFTLLKSIKPRFPLRIFMTSRKLPDMPRLQRMLDDSELVVIEVAVNDTLKDIELYVHSKIADLPVDEDEEREALAQQILTKSGTSFLWVRLVMDELEGVYGYDSITQVLQGIPEGMFPYYARAVAEMSEKKREQHVAKAILSWVMLATRPLSLSELSHALQLDINVHLPSVKSAVEGLCGQLVSVDVHTTFVHPVHATAREFILSEGAGEFQVLKTRGHENIALTCLRLLISPDMQPPRHRRLLNQKKAKPSTTGLADYAITQFTEHVVSASTESDQLLLALEKFLRSTVLTWIEKIVLEGEVHLLIRAAKNLKAYLNRRAKYHSPLNRHVNTIEAWATDLTRIVSSFGRALVRSPNSVYFIIPPLCPTQSAVFRQFGRTTDGMGLSGYRQSDWSDCVASIRFDDEMSAAVGCSNSLIAVGMESGALKMYNSRSFQKEGTIATGFPVDMIHLDPFGSFVAISTRKSVGVWHIDGTMRWKSRIRTRCILLTSSQDVLIGITQHGRLYHWVLDTGELVQEQACTYRAPESDANTQTSAGKAPFAASLSPGSELLALAYRNSPVCIFECTTGGLIGWAIDENNRAAEQILFNPNPEIGLLLVAYNESHLALYDSWSGSLIESAEAESHVILNSATCSPDGRTFAAVDIRGHLRIWDFESLTLLYHVLTPNNAFSRLHFTSDGLGLLHAVDHELKVWAPSALVRKTIEEEASFSDESPVLPVTEGQFERFHASKLRTLIAHPSRPILFAGNYNGDVVMYQSGSDYQPSTIYAHTGVIIRCLASSMHNAIASADIHANVQVRQFDTSEGQLNRIDSPLFQEGFSTPVVQLLFDTSGLYLLVSTIDSDHVYCIEDGVCVGSQTKHTSDREVCRWFTNLEPGYLDHFLLMTNQTLAAYSVKDFSIESKLICDFSITLTGTSIKTIMQLPQTSCIIVETQHAQSPITQTYIFTLPRWNPLGSNSSITTVTLSPDLCAQFLGINQASKRIIFLHPNSWLCSIALRELDAREYLEHFYVPGEYSSITSNGDSDVHPVQTADGDFAFCMYDKVVVIRGGLKFETRRAII